MAEVGVFVAVLGLSCWSSCCLVGAVTGFLSLRVAGCRGCCHFSVLGGLGVAKGVFGWFRCVIWFWVMGLCYSVGFVVFGVVRVGLGVR